MVLTQLCVTYVRPDLHQDPHCHNQWNFEVSSYKIHSLKSTAQLRRLRHRSFQAKSWSHISQYWIKARLRLYCLCCLLQSAYRCLWLSRSSCDQFPCQLLRLKQGCVHKSNQSACFARDIQVRLLAQFWSSKIHLFPSVLLLCSQCVGRVRRLGHFNCSLSRLRSLHVNPLDLLHRHQCGGCILCTLNIVRIKS